MFVRYKKRWIKWVNKMKIKKNNKLSIIFIIGLFIILVVIDKLFSMFDPVASLEVFYKNDFEKTWLSHQDNKEERERIYDKVFFGNSTVIAAYAEEKSISGYVNMGMDYATIKDLLEILEGEFVQITDELVLGINYLTFLDTFDTNPSYIWHKKPWEPYLYFHRDRLHNFITEGIKNVLVRESFVTVKYTDLNKYYYYGVLSDKELNEKIEIHGKKYWSISTSEYQENMVALKYIIDYCNQRGVRLRCVWMPWNPYVDKPVNVLEVEEQVNQILEQAGIEVLNLSNNFSRESFHDLGHLNYATGRSKFMGVIDEWLSQ